MKTTKFQRHFFFALFGLLMLSSCANIQKLTNNEKFLQKEIDAGRYDSAIDYCVKKLRGKNKKKQKFVTALEDAFNRANERDMKRINSLDKRGDVRSLESVLSIANTIDDRQRLLEPLLPVIDREGYQAEFRFVKVEEISEKSKGKVAVLLYEQGLDYMASAERGNKNDARNAYNTFRKIDRYFTNYRGVDQLKNKAHNIGITHIRFRVDNNSPVVVPQRFMEEFQSFGTRDLNSFWNKFYIGENVANKMDFEVVMKVRDVEVLPESVKEVQYIDRKEVEDGWEYVLDESGNVLKDTLGNDIKIPRYRFVEAFVLETFQHKEVRVEAILEFRNLRNNMLIDTERLGSVAVFENYASTYRGDSRALSSRTRCNLGNRPIPFPNTEAMLIEAAGKMKPTIKSTIGRQKLI